MMLEQEGVREQRERETTVAVQHAMKWSGGNTDKQERIVDAAAAVEPPRTVKRGKV